MRANSVGFVLGIVAFAAMLLLPPLGAYEESAAQLVSASAARIEPAELVRSMQCATALLLVMVIWWVTEAVPLSATALLPPVVLPLLHVTGIQGSAVHEFTVRNVLVNYASPVIYLFFGGFLLAAAMQKWQLDRRLTLWLLTRGEFANRPRSIMLGMMFIAAFLSMWISNTATTAMMLPIGLGVLSVVGLEPGKSRYGTALMLGIAWAASIGGVGTIIGSPPNGIALGILNSTFGGQAGYERITFLDWMKFGVPYIILFIPVAWLLLLRFHRPEIDTVPGGKERMQAERAGLGPMGRGQQFAIVMFLLAVLLWVSNPFWPKLLPHSLANTLSWINEYSIGLGVGVMMFFVPVDLRGRVFLLDWEDTKFVDWGTLILFGGGIALSEALFKTGLASLIAASFVQILGEPSTLVMMLAIIILIDFLTEITSNTAVTTMMVPIIISIALRTGENPITLSIAAAVAASMAFMLPVATPPNALVYGTGFVSIRDMIRAGVILDVLGWLVTVAVLVIFGGWVFGVLEF